VVREWGKCRVEGGEGMWEFKMEGGNGMGVIKS